MPYYIHVKQECIYISTFSIYSWYVYNISYDNQKSNNNAVRNMLGPAFSARFLDAIDFARLGSFEFKKKEEEKAKNNYKP